MARLPIPWLSALVAALLSAPGPARAQVACGDTVTGKVELTGTSRARPPAAASTR
jgi:hypothetical protein